jgi:hypothetical protein
MHDSARPGLSHRDFLAPGGTGPLPRARSIAPGQAVDSARSITYAGFLWRAVGTCFSQHATEQNRSFMRPALHDATVHRTVEAPGGINVRHVAQTMLAMPFW